MDILEIIMEKAILKIIKDKKVDINTYIYNTCNYREYKKETKHLKKEYILRIEEYELLRQYFKEK